MGMFDKFKKKASDLAGEHSDKADKGTEAAGDFIDEKTGGKHKEHVDKAQEKAREMWDKNKDRER